MNIRMTLLLPLALLLSACGTNLDGTYIANTTPEHGNANSVLAALTGNLEGQPVDMTLVVHGKTASVMTRSESGEHVTSLTASSKGETLVISQTGQGADIHLTFTRLPNRTLRCEDCAGYGLATVWSRQ
jgi:hypothetical protein